MFLVLLAAATGQLQPKKLQRADYLDLDTRIKKLVKMFSPYHRK